MRLLKSIENTMSYLTIEETIGNTPLIQLQRIGGEDAVRRNNIILGKDGKATIRPVRSRTVLRCP